MIIPNQKITLKWSGNINAHYIERGCEYTGRFEEFTVNIEDLSPSSHKLIKVQCDYCFEIVEKVYKTYNQEKKNSPIIKDCCKKCQPIKYKESNQLKYGVNCPFQIPSIKQKVNETIMEKYGVENVFANEDIKQKIKDYWVSNFGVESHNQLESVKKKKNQTSYENGTTQTSSQQNYIHQIIKGELNYPVLGYSLDIAFPDEMIYLEYNGSGHWLSVKMGSESEKEFKNRNIKRYYSIKRKGWRLIEITSLSDKLPCKNELIYFVKLAKEYLNQGNNWINLDIDQSKLITKHYETDYSFNKLIKIKKSNMDKKEISV